MSFIYSFYSIQSIQSTNESLHISCSWMQEPLWRYCGTPNFHVDHERDQRLQIVANIHRQPNVHIHKHRIDGRSIEAKLAQIVDIL